MIRLGAICVVFVLTLMNPAIAQMTEYLTFYNSNSQEIGQDISFDETTKEIVNESHFHVTDRHQLNYECDNWYGVSWYYVPLNVPENASKLGIEFPSIQVIRSPKYDGSAPKLFSYIISDRLPATKGDIDFIRANNLWKKEYGTSSKNNDILRTIANIKAEIPSSKLDALSNNVIYIVYRAAHSWKNGYSMKLQIASPEITWSLN